MGIAAAMSENMKKNMEAQMGFQKELILKQRQAQMAMQIAMARERLTYYSYFYGLAVPLLIVGAIKNKNPSLIGPVIPLTVAWLCQYDMAYGDMMDRARDTADNLITSNPYKFYLPEHSGIVTTA